MDPNNYREMCFSKRSYAVKRDQKKVIEYYVQQRKKEVRKKNTCI